MHARHHPYQAMERGDCWDLKKGADCFIASRRRLCQQDVDEILQPPPYYFDTLPQWHTTM